jgi:hypothetical protein
MADPDKNGEFKGIDGTVEFIIAWNGNKNVGEGEMEITNIIEGKRIEIQTPLNKKAVRNVSEQLLID